jgi:triosephosphate isomerase
MPTPFQGLRIQADIRVESWAAIGAAGEGMIEGWPDRSIMGTAMARRTLIAGNWKMNGLRADGIALARDVAAAGARDVELLICPPATLVERIAEAVSGSNVAVGGQDCHADAGGAHTGDVSAEMLADAGARYVILGHSERRTDHGETDAVVHAKAQAAWRAGLTAIVCIGETLAEREAGRTLDVLATQLKGSVPAGATAATLVLAYEPVWAIGTGKTPTVAEVDTAHRHIREVAGGMMNGAADLRILYGGSMKPSNAAELLAVTDVDGGLIGGASLKAADFLAIAAARA